MSAGAAASTPIRASSACGAGSRRRSSSCSAAILRLWDLAHPHALVFDETYYVKDAWSQWNLGYPSTWPENADERFAAGETDIFTTIGSYVVHPPLGKWIIGAGMAIFGADSSFGWRVAVALFGTATILVLYFVARRLGGSIVFASVAALFFAVDGLGIVLGRVGLLDGILTFFVLLGFWFVLLDRQRHHERLAAAIAARTVDGRGPDWGPVFWNRPWLIAAGAAFGAATAVKWSGLFVIAAVGIYLVVDDALTRRKAGVGYWPADATLRQGLASFVLYVPIAFVVYLASWTGWLVTDGGYDRHAADGSRPATGLLVVGAAVPAEPVDLSRGDLRLERGPDLAAQLCEPRVAVAAHAAPDLDVLPGVGDR